MRTGIVAPSGQRGRQGRRALSTWAARIADTWPPDADVYAYFNNDPGGAAVLDATLFTRFTRPTAPASPDRPAEPAPRPPPR
nr:DUF72 domain-containing protein [Streptomyces sp. JJ66]